MMTSQKIGTFPKDGDNYSMKMHQEDRQDGCFKFLTDGNNQRRVSQRQARWQIIIFFKDGKSKAKYKIRKEGYNQRMIAKRQARLQFTNFLLDG